MAYFTIGASTDGRFYEHWTGIGWHTHPAYALIYRDRFQAHKALKQITKEPPNGAVPQILEQEGYPPSWGRVYDDLQS